MGITYVNTLTLGIDTFLENAVWIKPNINSIDLSYTPYVNNNMAYALAGNYTGNLTSVTNINNSNDIYAFLFFFRK